MTQDFTQPGELSAADLETLRTLNTVGTVSYVLHLIVAIGAVIPGGQMGPLLLLVALVLDWVYWGKAAGTWHASHFRWRIRTVLIAAGLYLLTAPLWALIVLPGWLAWTAISIWFLYRIVTGFLAMNKGQAMEMDV